MKINFERIKYSPFGYKIFGNLIPTVAVLTFVNLLLALCVWGALGTGKMYFSSALCAVLLGCCIYLEYKTVSDKLFQAKLISAMTDEEHNELVKEYKKFKENNDITLGCMTSYGIILDEQICPWDIIKEIEFTPNFKAQKGKYQYIVSTTVKLHVVYGKHRRVIKEDICNYPADISEDIQQFKSAISKYTDREIKINNRYYHTIF
ncbi:MAG: hypothetical protein IKK74_09160 [Clostridia bacterium]|nr:hypothetical protein [Clostridia bacterium]